MPCSFALTGVVGWGPRGDGSRAWVRSRQADVESWRVRADSPGCFETRPQFVSVGSFYHRVTYFPFNRQLTFLIRQFGAFELTGDSTAAAGKPLP